MLTYRQGTTSTFILVFKHPAHRLREAQSERLTTNPFSLLRYTDMADVCKPNQKSHKKNGGSSGSFFMGGPSIPAQVLDAQLFPCRQRSHIFGLGAREDANVGSGSDTSGGLLPAFIVSGPPTFQWIQPQNRFSKVPEASEKTRGTKTIWHLGE